MCTYTCSCNIECRQCSLLFFDACFESMDLLLLNLQVHPLSVPTIENIYIYIYLQPRGSGSCIKEVILGKNVKITAEKQ